MATEAAAGKETPKPGDEQKPAAGGEQKPASEQTPKAEDKAAEGDGTTDDKKPNDDGGAAGDKHADPNAPPEKYELTVPEGSAITAADLPLYEARAKRLGLSQTQATALIDAETEMYAAINTKLSEDLAADPQMGGDNLPGTLELAKQGIEASLRGLKKDHADVIRGWLNDPKFPIGNHKAAVAFFLNIGKRMQEDKPAAGGGGGAEKRDAADVLWPAKK